MPLSLISILGRGGFNLIVFLVNSDVVYVHLLREVRGDAFGDYAVHIRSANRQVKQNIESLIERRRERAVVGFAAGPPDAGAFVEMVVAVPADLFGVPFDCVQMIALREIGPVFIGRRAGSGIVRKRSSKVQIGSDFHGCIFGFHNIDLAAGGPTAVGIIRGHHPERRPHTFTAGKLDARFDMAVTEVLLMLGNDTGRGERFAVVRFLLSDDDQIAVFDV